MGAVSRLSHMSKRAALVPIGRVRAHIVPLTDTHSFHT
jgi:hypothetical protein